MDGNGRTKLGRRALLAAGAAAVAASAAQAVAPASAQAANGDPLKIGQGNSGTTYTDLTASGTTALRCYSDVGNGLQGETSGEHKAGVFGRAGLISSVGVEGEHISFLNSGYLGTADHGVMGWSHVSGKAGIYGYHSTAGSPGVLGANSSNHSWGTLGGQFGVAGHAPSTLLALAVSGKAGFSRSGITTIAKSTQSATIAGIALTADSFVVATLLQYRSGVWVAAAVPNVAAGSITIHLNKKVTSPITVGWVVLERFAGFSS
jgi:hypothetical protein